MKSPSTTPPPVWRERYLDHPLVGVVARRLIWIFNDGSRETAAVWLADDPDVSPHGPGRLVCVDGSTFDPPAECIVSLWRPIPADAPPGSTAVRDDVAAWRTFYEERGLRQPFKQAHREIYLLTDAERATGVYSNRFAGHILRQHQFNALGAQRGWISRTRMFLDAEYPPAHRLLPEWGLRAEFWVDGAGDPDDDNFTLESGAIRYLVVLGKRRTYRIHLGSGNVRMEPDGEYLCIVPDCRMEAGPGDEVMLPFEGDLTLAVILSKAFLLAEDDKIKDPTILSQLDHQS